MCVDDTAEYDRLVPIRRAYANLVGVSPGAMRLEFDAIPDLMVASGARTRALFLEAGLIESQEVFRTPWYRCWISRSCPS